MTTILLAVCVYRSRSSKKLIVSLSFAMPGKQQLAKEFKLLLFTNR